MSRPALTAQSITTNVFSHFSLRLRSLRQDAQTTKIAMRALTFSPASLTVYSNNAIIRRWKWRQLSSEFTIEYVELPNGRAPAREFVDSLDDKAAARIDAFIDRLRIYGNRMQGKFVKKLTDHIFELRVKQFDRIFRVLFFYQPGMLIVVTSGFQKKTEQTPQAEITKAEQLRMLWMKYRNHYAGSQKEKEAILKELGL